MTKRDYESQPASDALGLDDVIKGLAQDLNDLRAKRISIQDAHARAAIAKQLFNGCRIYLQAEKTLQEKAKPVGAAALSHDDDNR